MSIYIKKLHSRVKAKFLSYQIKMIISKINIKNIFIAEKVKTM